MSTITLDTSSLTIVIILQLVFFQLWQYFYGEKTKLELHKGLNSFKSMPATVKKQFKTAIKEELAELDWSEILPEEFSSGQGLLQTILGNLPDIVGLYDYMKKGEGVAKDVLEVAGKAASKTVKEVAKEKKK